MGKFGREKQNNRAAPYSAAAGPAGKKPAERLGGPSVVLNKALGQHLLRNTGILDKIIEAAEFKSSDIVLEIGPGTGNLTLKVLPLVKTMKAIEVDQRMAAEVKKRAFDSGRLNLEVIQGDALRTQFPPFDVCVANLPYQISSSFTFKLLSHRPLFRSAVIMFQKEFAERLVAQVGEPNYGRLALNVGVFCVCTRVCKVSRNSFNPPPKVDSMVVKFVPHKKPIAIDFPEWDGLLRLCFIRKHKLLHAQFKQKSVIKLLQENYTTYCALKGQAPAKDFKAHLLGALAASGFSQRRAITICMEEYMQLLLCFHQNGIHFHSGPKKGLDELAASMDVDAEEDGMEDDL